MAPVKKLELVPATSPPVVDFTEGFEPLLLSTVELLDRYWLQASDLLERCIEDAMHGEMTLDDMYDAIKSGTMYALVIKNDAGEIPRVALVLVMEAVGYPRMAVLNIVAMGGHNLSQIRDKFWKQFCSWAYINGVRHLQALTSPAMARILKSYGFEPVYITLRMGLTEL